jgi:DNA-binding CsgD family transcriptional regulator
VGTDVSSYFSLDSAEVCFLRRRGFTLILAGRAAAKLHAAENTVKAHSSRLFEKMQVNRRVQAVQKGKDLGLIP